MSFGAQSGSPRGVDKAKLAALLEQNDKVHGIEYLGHHSNDLALALVAIADLGGNEEKLKQFYRRYEMGEGTANGAALASPPPSQKKITQENWAASWGQTKYSVPNQFNSEVRQWYQTYIRINDWGSYRDFFKTQLDGAEARKGSAQAAISEVVAQYFPHVMRAVGSAHFRPLLLLSQGIEVELPVLVAEGLAYLCLGFTSFGDATIEEVEDLPLENILEETRNDVRFDRAFAKRLEKSEVEEDEDEAGRQLRALQLLASVPELTQLLRTYGGKWNITRVSPSELLREVVFASARLVEMTDAKDEELISAAVAALALAPFVHVGLLSDLDKRHLLRYFWIALLATYIARGRPSLNPTDVEDMLASQLAASEVAQSHVAAGALNLTSPTRLLGVRTFLSATHVYPQCKGLFMRLAQLCISQSP